MKKTIVSVFMIILLFCGVNFVQADDYEPLPGVLSPEDVDFEGETVTIYSRAPVPFKSVIEEGEDYERWGSFNETIKERVKKAEELFNVSLDFGGQISEEDVQNRVLSGDSTHDIYFGQHRQFNYFGLANDKLIYKVGDILPEEYYESLHNTDKQYAKRMRLRGEYYSFGNTKGPHNPTIMFMMYNKDLIEENDQPDPYELYQDDEWDYQAMEDIMKAVTKDTDGDGEYDQVGMYDQLGESALRLMPFNQLEITRQNEEGNFIFDLDSEKGVETLNLIAKWRNEDQVTSEATEVSDDDLEVAFSPGYAIVWWPGVDADHDFGVVPYPKGPDAERYLTPSYTFWVTTIPANAEDPEGLIALYEYLIRYDDEERHEAYINELMETRIQTEEHWDMYMEGVENWQGEGDPFQYSGLWEIVLAPVNEVLTGEEGAKSRMKEIQPEAQSFIDDFFN